MNVLVIAPHMDDEIIGVGGTIAKRVEQGNSVYVCVVTKGCRPIFRENEIGKNECKKADALLGVKETVFLDFPAAMLEEIPRYQLNQALMDVVQKFNPNEVYIPHRGDMQLDHKLVVDAAMVALRPKYEHAVRKIYAYETMSETGWDIPNICNEFIPTVYEDISMTLQKKMDALEMYESQIMDFPNARSLEAILALAKYRGTLMSLEAAEAFELIREIKSE